MITRACQIGISRMDNYAENLADDFLQGIKTQIGDITYWSAELAKVGAVMLCASLEKNTDSVISAVKVVHQADAIIFALSPKSPPEMNAAYMRTIHLAIDATLYDGWHQRTYSSAVRSVMAGISFELGILHLLRMVGKNSVDQFFSRNNCEAAWIRKLFVLPSRNDVGDLPF